MKKRTQAFVLFNMFLILLVIIGNYGCNSNSSTSYPTPSPNGGGTQGANEVWLQGIAFNPASKTITAGTTIIFTNKDNTTHTVTSGVPGTPDGVFNSGDLTNGKTFSFTFNNKGTFKYYCQIHGAMMTATMIVQ